MEVLEKTFEATIENLHPVLDLLEAELESHDASMKMINVICVAAEEMYANVAMYAYADKEKPGDCSISIWFENDIVSIKFVDSGVPFNPLAKTDPNIHATVEERGIGGLGIYMVKETMDDCSYERIDGKNIFVMRKAIK